MNPDVDVQLWASDTRFLGIVAARVDRADTKIEVSITRDRLRAAAIFDQVRMVAIELDDGERFVGIVSRIELSDTYPAYVRLSATDVAQHFINGIIWPGMNGYELKASQEIKEITP